MTALYRSETILVIRLGAMGDVLHALPAVASLKMSFPDKKLVWLVARRWMPLMEGNPYIDELIPFERTGAPAVFDVWRKIRQLEPELAVDLQGLVQSALAGRMSRPKQFYGFDRTVARERLAAALYTKRVHVTGPHRIERNLQLVAATGATRFSEDSWIPQGSPEGTLPNTAYILASPFAGWRSKEWPLEFYDRLGRCLKEAGLRLIINVPSERAREVQSLKNVTSHTSSLPGLIHASRRASAIVGVDSGPLHLAAALGKPGVALFGPTDPAQTGPFKSPMVVLRGESAQTTYKRAREIHSSMVAISPEQVCQAILRSLADVRQAAEAAV